MNLFLPLRLIRQESLQLLCVIIITDTHLISPHTLL